MLRLHLNPKNQPWEILNYPIIGFDYIDILYSKEKHKYRFNQVWDITTNRGEYNDNWERVVWNTAANGYVKVLDANNLNYNKSSFERKKFRHYQNYVFLRRRVCGNRKMLVMVANTKNLISPR
jgi:hypothetical protein